MGNQNTQNLTQNSPAQVPKDEELELVELEPAPPAPPAPAAPRTPAPPPKAAKVKAGQGRVLVNTHGLPLSKFKFFNNPLLFHHCVCSPLSVSVPPVPPNTL